MLYTAPEPLTKHLCSMQCTNQLRVVSPVLSGVQRVGHEPLQQRHAKAKSSSQLGLHYWTQLTGISSQHHLIRRKKENRHY